MTIKTGLALGLSAAVLLAGAAQGQSTAKPTPANVSTAKPAAAKPGAATAYPAFFAKTCSQCHDYSVATTQQHTPKEWSDLVDKMVDLGLTAPDDKLTQIKDYLSHAFPKK